MEITLVLANRKNSPTFIWLPPTYSEVKELFSETLLKISFTAGK